MSNITNLEKASILSDLLSVYLVNEGVRGGASLDHERGDQTWLPRIQQLFPRLYLTTATQNEALGQPAWVSFTRGRVQKGIDWTRQFAFLTPGIDDESRSFDIVFVGYYAVTGGLQIRIWGERVDLNQVTKERLVARDRLLSEALQRIGLQAESRYTYKTTETRVLPNEFRKALYEYGKTRTTGWDDYELFEAIECYLFVNGCGPKKEFSDNPLIEKFFPEIERLKNNLFSQQVRINVEYFGFSFPVDVFVGEDFKTVLEDIGVNVFLSSSHS